MTDEKKPAAPETTAAPEAAPPATAAAEATPPATAEQDVAKPEPTPAADPKPAEAASTPKTGKDAAEEEERAPKARRIPPARARWGLRMLVLLILLVIIALLLWWKHCLPGQGGGGPQSAKDSGPAAMTGGAGEANQGAACTLRVDAKGIAVAGQPATDPAAALKACGGAKRAVLTVTGDARFGTADEVEKALRAAGIAVQRKR